MLPRSFINKSLQSPPSTNHQIAYSISQNVIAVTPEKNATNTSSSMLEMESSLNLSVSSHTQKRRESIYLSLGSLFQQHNDYFDSKASD